MDPVRSHRSKTVVDAARLHRSRDRRREGLTLLEGPHLLADAVAAGARVQSVFAVSHDDQSASLARDHGIELLVVDDRALARLAGTESPRGPVAVVEIPPPAPLGSESALLVSWGVSDPGNVGTMIRTAAGFGWRFGYTVGTADPWSPKVLRSAAGYQFRVALSPISGLDELRQAGFKVLATVVEGGRAPEMPLPTPLALLVGEEATGLPDVVVAGSDDRLSIPMPGGTESLNAAVAAGIMVYAISKHFGQPRGRG